MTALLKSVLWRGVAVLPVRLWPEASALIRRARPKVRHG